MRIALIFGIVILAAACMYTGARLTRRLTHRQLWTSLVVALIAYAALLHMQVAPWPISDITIMLVAVLAGSAIGLALPSSPSLVAFCITAGIVDFLSFRGGLTSKIIADYNQGHNLLLQYLCITAPISGRPIPIIGIGDLIILGSVFCALSQIGYDGWLSFVFPLGGVLIALAVGLLKEGAPAIPFIAGATIVYVLLKAKTRSSQ